MKEIQYSTDLRHQYYKLIPTWLANMCQKNNFLRFNSSFLQNIQKDPLVMF